MHWLIISIVICVYFYKFANSNWNSCKWVADESEWKHAYLNLNTHLQFDVFKLGKPANGIYCWKWCRIFCLFADCSNCSSNWVIDVNYFSLSPALNSIVCVRVFAFRIFSTNFNHCGCIQTSNFQNRINSGA